MKLPTDSSLARHTVRGSAYSAASSAVTIGMGVLRTYLMVRLLLPDQIGLAALALFYVNLGVQFGSLGLGDAFIQRPAPTEADRRTFYTFHLLIGIGSLAAVAALAPLIAGFYPAYTGLQALIWAYAGISLVRVFNQPQVRFLEKSLSFKEMAILDSASAVASTIVGPGMALLGFGVWAIVGDYAAGFVIRFLLLHLWLLPFRPRLAWDRQAAGWLWSFGKTVWMSSNLTYLIDTFDDFWVGTALGKSPLGLYSKAYEFARYPRRVVANPVISVFFPTFAHVQDDRVRLSRAFFRATSLVIRAGALFSLVFVLAAPEAFRLFLPAAWLPMLTTFQLMILYTFLDPISVAAQQLLTATGRPQEVKSIRWLQLAVFIPAVIAGSAWRGIEGVALAADLMVLTGTVLLFARTRRVVDYSMAALWLRPAAGLVLIGGLIFLLAPLWAGLPDLAVLIAKGITIPVLYGGFLWAFERNQLRAGIGMIRGQLRQGD